jgi:hypothetical protein
MARARHERATDEHATDVPVPAAITTGDPQALHAILAAYFAALAAIKRPPPPLGAAGLSALVYWQKYFENPDHLFPQDEEHRFVRGLIWS